VSVAKRVSQLGGETVIYGIAGTISRFIGIFLIPLYTRAFSPADYGQIAILTAFVTLLSTFIVLGLDSASGRCG
jgi:O-antigen/teichoic acid export membrane protein